MVHDGAVHREAAVKTNREGHESLAGRRIVGVLQRRSQESKGGKWLYPMVLGSALSRMLNFNRNLDKLEHFPHACGQQFIKAIWPGNRDRPYEFVIENLS